MGYYTKFELDIIGPTTESVEIKGAVDENGNPIKAFRQVVLDSAALEREISDEAGYAYVFGASCKWYDHEINMKTVSRKHPSLVFVLTGIGEESGDLWRKYFKNGKMQKAPGKIIYDNFDESKLA